jgi:ribulose-phosphate 3-epimerase
MNNGNRVKVAPSIFAADFYNLSKALKLYDEAGVDRIHFDVMDNHFVPNISFGAKVISDIMARTKIPAEAHLMIDLNNHRWESFLELPVVHLTVHLEAAYEYILDIVEKIKNSGKTAGISVSPETPIEVISSFLNEIDMVLIMSVEPGFSGQKFMGTTLEKIRKARVLMRGRPISIQVDGGVNRMNYKETIKAGADFLVAGTAFYQDENIVEWVNEIHSGKI